MNIIQDELYDQLITPDESIDRTVQVKFRARGMKRRLELLAQKPQH